MTASTFVDKIVRAKQYILCTAQRMNCATATRVPARHRAIRLAGDDLTGESLSLALEALEAKVLLACDIGAEIADDHCNDAANSTPVEVQSVTPGNIETPGDSDWFQFQARRWSAYTLQAGGITLPDTQLTLYDSDGTTVIEFDDDGGGGLNSKIQWTAPATDTYFLEVRSHDMDRGAYWLDITSRAEGPALLVEIAAAGVVELNETSLATVWRTTESTGELTVKLQSSDTSEATVPAQVVIPAGSPFATFIIKAVDDFEVDGSHRVAITASAPGFVDGADSLIIVDNDDPNLGDDHGNAPESATLITVSSSSSIAGNIEMGADSDWFRLDATAGTTYVIETVLDTHTDTVLRVRGVNGIVAFNDDGGIGLGSKITWTAPRTEDFYVEVSPFGVETGTYTLVVSA